MNNNIRHWGVVDGVGDGCLKVRILQTSACASCKVSGHCTASESKEKVVDVYDKNLPDLHKGDKVVVVASQRTGFLAVLLSSVIPLFILVSVLVSVLTLSGSEAGAALLSICALLPYYLLLYLFRERIRSRLSFHIDPLSIDNGISAGEFK